MCNKSSQPAVCSPAPGLMFSQAAVHYSVHYFFSACCVFPCSWAHFLKGSSSLQCALTLLSQLCVPLFLGSCSQRLKFTTVCTKSSQPVVFPCSWSHVLTDLSSLQCELNLLSLLCVPLLLGSCSHTLQYTTVCSKFSQPAVCSLFLGTSSHRLQFTTVCTMSSQPAVCSPVPGLMFSQAAVHKSVH
jgi:hypothetical protein